MYIVNNFVIARRSHVKTETGVAHLDQIGHPETPFTAIPWIQFLVATSE